MKIGGMACNWIKSQLSNLIIIIMNKLRYKGKNRYNEFLSAAKIVSGKISKINGIVGILATGGLSRYYCDDYSDLDLIIYADDKKLKEIKKYIATGYLRYKNIELDAPVESYRKALNQKSPSEYWSQVARWDKENSQILFDTNDKIKNLLKKKLIFPDWEQKDLLEEHREGINEYSMYAFELWEKRGSLINTKHSLIQSIEHLVLWIYAKNKKFQPYTSKWLFYYLENDLVFESKYFNLIKKLYLSPTKTIKQARNARNEVIKLSKKLGVKFDYENTKEFFERDYKNWEKASNKTKFYLSW